MIVTSWTEQRLVDNLHQDLSVSLTNRLAVGAKTVRESHVHRAADKEKCSFIFFFVTFNSCIMSLAILENHISYPWEYHSVLWGWGSRMKMAWLCWVSDSSTKMSTMLKELISRSLNLCPYNTVLKPHSSGGLQEGVLCKACVSVLAHEDVSDTDDGCLLDTSHWAKHFMCIFTRNLFTFPEVSLALISPYFPEVSQSS